MKSNLFRIQHFWFRSGGWQKKRFKKDLHFHEAIMPVLRSRSRKELHHLVGAGAITRCDSGSGSSSEGSGSK
jgi:hypothetical protein